jgi:hypothetical protein
MTKIKASIEEKREAEFQAIYKARCVSDLVAWLVQCGGEGSLHSSDGNTTRYKLIKGKPVKV